MKGVLIAAFGGAREEGEVPSFLRSLRGEEPPPWLISSLEQKYRLIGGSPLFAILERIVDGLRRRLKGVQLTYGVLHGAPSLEEAIEELEGRGVFEVLLFPLSPYRSPYTTEAIYDRAHRRLEELAIMSRRPNPWFDHPEYVRLWVTRIKEEISSFGRAPLVFSAHSLRPEASSPYREDVEATVRGVLDQLPRLPWRLAFQSGREGWLGPGPKEVLQELKGRGAERAIVVPIGFLCDHLETLYDLDLELREWAEVELEMELGRVSCLNASEDFITFLAKRILEGFRAS